MIIEEYHFGSMTIDERRYRNDLKIIKGEVVSSWWRKEGHSVELEDVDDILSAKPRVLVVGTGQPGRMEVTRSLRSALDEAGIQLIEEPTALAMHTFNRLQRRGENVAGAFHLTC
jgi:hypothetical protein